MNRKMLAPLLAISALAPVAAGCGDSSSDPGSDSPATMEEISVASGPFDTSEDFVAAADDVCTQANDVFQLSPVLGQYFNGIAAEGKQDVELIGGREDKLAELEAPDALSGDYDAYLAAGQDVLDAYSEMGSAAANEDQKALDAAFSSITDAQNKRNKLSRRLGFEVCSANIKPTTDETIEGSAIDAEQPEIDGTLDESVEAFQKASAKGECTAVNDLVNSQFGVITDRDCKANKPFYANSELIGTHQYGPVGLAVFWSEQDGATDSTFIRDEDGRLKFTGNRFLDGGGLHTPADGYDAQEVADAVIEAIRGDDPKAFNAELGEDVADPKGGFYVKGDSFDRFGSDDKYGPMLVKDIRADEDAAPELLGANTNSAYFLLEASGNFYELGMAHEPGSPTEYSFSQYYALPE